MNRQGPDSKHRMSLKTITDPELVEIIQSGDPNTKGSQSNRARNELVSRHIGLARKFAGKDEDVYQLALEGLVHAANVYDPKWAFSTVAMNWFRKMLRNNIQMEDPIPNEPLVFFPESDDLEARIVAAKLSIWEDTIARLATQGFGYEDIRHTLGITKQKMSKYIASARRKIASVE